MQEGRVIAYASR
jgi:hypothetical protein